jgi:hypothetical protein
MARQATEIYSPTAGSGSLPGLKVGPAITEINQPLSVNVGGDVGFDYDIVFMNTGLSQITSEGPLRISAGDSNHYENLTLTTGGTGDVIIDIASSTIGLKMLGKTAGGYVALLTPTGDLTVAQDILTLGGNLTLQQLSAPSAPTFNSTSTGGSCLATTYYYRIAAFNDNGTTTASATTSADGTPGSTIINISWVPVNGAEGYVVYRSTSASFSAGDTASSTVITSGQTTSFADDCAGDVNRVVPSSNTTGGGITTTGNILPSADNTYNLGSASYRWANLYAATTSIGDIVFANQFRLTEILLTQEGVLTTTSTTSTLQGLAFVNASSTPIFMIDENGWLQVNKVSAKEVVTEKLKVGVPAPATSTTANGITIYDRVTGEPYCIYFENGEMKTAAGECGNETSSSQTSTQSNQSTGSSAAGSGSSGSSSATSGGESSQTRSVAATTTEQSTTSTEESTQIGSVEATSTVTTTSATTSATTSGTATTTEATSGSATSQTSSQTSQSSSQTSPSTPETSPGSSETTTSETTTSETSTGSTNQTSSEATSTTTTTTTNATTTATTTSTTTSTTGQ